MSGRPTADVRSTLSSLARDLLERGYHCSESVVLAVGPSVARDWHPICARASTCFAGGVGGSTQELCGALAGSLMVIGAIYGRSSLQDDARAQALASAFRRRFLAAYGTTQCAQLRQAVVKSEGGLGSCAVLVEQVTEMLLDLLDEAGSAIEALPDP